MKNLKPHLYYFIAANLFLKTFMLNAQQCPTIIEALPSDGRNVECSSNSDYIPNTNGSVPATGIITYNVNLHLFQQSNGVGYLDHVTYADVQYLFFMVEQNFENLQLPKLPTNPPAPFVPKTHIRFNVKAIYRWQDDLAYGNNPYITNYFYDTYGVNKNKELNVFLLHVNEGYGWGPSNFSIINHPLSKDPNIFINDKTLGHELGHTLAGLSHAHQQPCDNGVSVPQFDDFAINSNCGWIPCQDGVVSNNVMGYNNCENYFSPKQIANFHYYVHRGYTTRYTTFRDYNPINDINITSNQSWNIARAVGGNIIVKSGYTLNINCLLYMPKDGKIIVERGAQLIINGTVTNNWAEGWDGIEVWGTSTQSQGVTSAQGRLTMNSGSMLEYMKKGVRTIKVTGVDPDGSDLLDATYTGGILY
jgi:hypothetical protein